MTEHEASRTLVKSPPELWAECSEAASLARHLGRFGEIRITRLEPVTAVAWEGEEVSGTVRLEPSGWGTKVVLTSRSSEGASTPAREPGEADVDGPPIQETSPTEPELRDGRGEEPARVEDREPLEVPEPPDPEPRPDPEPEPDPLPPAATASVAPQPGAGKPIRRRGLMARIMELFQPPEPPRPAMPVPLVSASTPPPEPSDQTEPCDQTEPPDQTVPSDQTEPPELAEPSEPVDPPDSRIGLDHAAVLAAALDSLGQAHHRPYSRS